MIKENFTKKYSFIIGNDVPIKDLVEQHNTMVEISERIVKILRINFLNQTVINIEAINIILNSLNYDENIYTDYFEEQFDIVDLLFKLDTQKKLPKLCMVSPNEDILISTSLKLLKNLYIENSSDICCAIEWFEKYSNSLKKYCKDKNIVNEKVINDTLEEIKLQIGDGISYILQAIFGKSGCDIEDYERLCDDALKYSPNNLEALKIKQWCLENKG